MKKGVSRLLTLLGVGIALAAWSGSAWATTAKTAANTQIINTATLTFTIGSTTASASASVSVLVSLVPSAPTVSISNPGAVGYTGTDTPALTDSVTILSTANGPAKYTVTPSINAAANSTGASVTPNVGTDIWLGASITSAPSSNSTVLSVPSVTFATDPDRNSAAQVNGLGIGDTIVFTDSGNVTQTLTILNVSNPGTASGNASITLSIPVTVATGTPLYEQTSSVNSFNITVKPGTIITPGTFLTVDVKAEVSGTGFAPAVSVLNSTASANANAGDANQPPTNLNVWTSAPASVNITKYVRNTSDAAANPVGNCSTVITGTSGTWCTSGVTGKAGNNLEYAVVAKNNADNAVGNLTSCTISDLLPPAFVTLACNGYNADEDVHFINTAGGVQNLKACGNLAGSWANWNPAGTPNLLVYVGNGAGNGTPGSLPFGQQVTITYNATIK